MTNDMWWLVKGCINLKILLHLKKNAEDPRLFQQLATHVYQLAAYQRCDNIDCKCEICRDPDYGFRSLLVQNLVLLFTLPQEERSPELEKTIDSLLAPDGSLELKYYHENGHWSKSLARKCVGNSCCGEQE